MSIAITCPNCGFSKEVPEDKVPAAVKWARCPQCSSRFMLPSRNPVPGPEGEHTARGPCAWEKRAQLGSWTAIYETLKGVLFSPGDLFGRMTFQGGARDPLLFGILIGSVGRMFGFFWDFLLMWGGIRTIGQGRIDQFTTGFIFILLMVFSPLLITVSILLTSGIMHLLLLITGAGRHRFEATMRVVSYAQATQIWGVVPFVGGMVAGVWFLVVQIIGLREIHETDYWRIFVAFLIPFVLVLVLIVFAVVFLSAMT